jgi:hypothetical protein
MTEYIVGLRHGKRSEVLTIEAEDANLIGAAISAILTGRNEGSDARVAPFPLHNSAML